MITSDPYGISHATRPWEPAAVSGLRCHIVSYDTPAQIQRCQTCKWPECINCLAQPVARGTRKARQDEFMRLYDRGETDSGIAATMGVTQQAVYYYRRKFGLVPNRRKSDPCIGCYNRDLCAAQRLACGTKLRWNESKEARR